MTDLVTAPNAGPRSLRLDTLVGLRWLAVVGQTAAVLVVNLVLGFPLPLASCLGLIAMSALVNVPLRIRYTASHRLDATPALLLLAYDVLQLSALLFLTGGLDNPFTVLLLVPLIVSATTLPPRPSMSRAARRATTLGGASVANAATAKREKARAVIRFFIVREF